MRWPSWTWVGHPSAAMSPVAVVLPVVADVLAGVPHVLAPVAPILEPVPDVRVSKHVLIVASRMKGLGIPL